mgnify:CR=1 FL=1
MPQYHHLARLPGCLLLRRSLSLCAALLAACGGGSASSDTPPLDASVAFTATDLDFPNPERGFYRFASDPSKITATSLLYVAQEGQRLVYTPGDLSAYRTRNLPYNYLTKLEAGFANLRKQGLKAVLRFAYNYPETESEYLNAQDATLSRVKSHIQQLQPVLQRNADVIAVVQGGFIGAWGEWHTSSNNLTTPARKAAVRDALLQALPSQRLLHLRYPADLAQWYPTTATLAQALSATPPPAARAQSTWATSQRPASLAAGIAPAGEMWSVVTSSPSANRIRARIDPGAITPLSRRTNGGGRR